MFKSFSKAFWRTVGEYFIGEDASLSVDWYDLGSVYSALPAGR